MDRSFSWVRGFLAVSLVWWLWGGPLRAGEWPQWRGPNANGVAPTGPFPLEGSETENVLWKAALPSRGASSPIVWRDTIFVTSAKGGKNAVFCFDRSGSLRWTLLVGTERSGRHRKASGANSSPTTDGQHVYVYFKSGDLAAVDFTGRVVWHVNLQKKYGKDTLWWDLATSPVLTRNDVVVACLQTGPSYLVALDKRTGRETWKQDRTFQVPKENDNCYTTPVVIERQGREEILVLGADHLTAHDGATGRELWQVGQFNPEGNASLRSIASPVVSGNLVVAPYHRGTTLTAVRIRGRYSNHSLRVAWKTEFLP